MKSKWGGILSEYLDRRLAVLSELYSERSKRFRRASFFVKFMLLAVASAVVSIMQFLQIPDDQKITTVQAVGIAFSILVFAGAVFTLITEEDATKELNAARDATEAVRDALEDLWDYEDSSERAIQLYQSSMVLRGIVERAGVSDSATILDVVNTFIEATRRPLPIAMGFDLSDHWTICVYQAERVSGAPDLLKCIDHNRSVPCPVEEARVWSEGIGVAGISYANNDEIIVPDLQALNLGSMFNVAGGTRTYDATRYKSIVSVPIKVDGQSKPWGVVVATSNQVSHFNLDEEVGPKTTEAVRLLSAMTALAVVMCNKNGKK